MNQLLLKMFIIGIKNSQEYLKKILEELSKIENHDKMNLGYKKGIEDCIKALETFENQAENNQSIFMEGISSVFNPERKQD